MKNFLPTRILIMMYYAHFHSYLNYSSHFLSMLPCKVFNRIRNLQKRAIRAVYKKSHLAHTSNLFKESRILPLDDLIRYNILNFMSLFSSNSLPNAFKEEWKYNYEISLQYLLRNANDIYEFKLSSNSLKKHPLFNFPLTWNKFKDEMKQISYPPLFKRKLKCKLIDEINDEICKNKNCYSCFGRT